MDRHGVASYRGVATSAAREASNRHVLIERIRQQARINLEVISGEEEARLVRVATLRALRNIDPPRFILDLGGGSLEISEMRKGVPQRSIGLPLGTVRLMEAFRVKGAIHEHCANDIWLHVLSVLQSALANRPRSTTAIAVACGGNAETLAALAPGPKFRGLGTMNVRLLSERLWNILQMDVDERIKTFGVRRDRAEVMGAPRPSSLVTVARWLRLRQLIIPQSVGVREWLAFQELAADSGVGAAPAEHRAVRKEARIMMAGAESRLRCRLALRPETRASKFALLALQLFDPAMALPPLEF